MHKYQDLGAYMREMEADVESDRKRVNRVMSELMTTGDIASPDDLDYINGKMIHESIIAAPCRNSTELRTVALEQIRRECAEAGIDPASASAAKGFTWAAEEFAR